jgi:hypothetical protein
MARGSRRKPRAVLSAEPDSRSEVQRRVSKTEVAIWCALFVGAIVALVWRHRTGFFLSWTDEQIHLYVARRVAEGAVLYRDIDSSRPPLAILPVAWLITLGCSPLLAGRALVLLSQLATAGFMLWGGWRLISWRAGALAALLFLTSPEVFDRVHYTGIQLVVLTTVACFLYFLRSMPFRSGLCFGLILATGQHGLAIGGLVALWTLVRRPRDGVRFLLGSLVVAALVFGPVWLMGGHHVWESLFGHHLYHLSSGYGGGDTQFGERLTPWLYDHAYLMVGVTLSLTLLRSRVRDGASRDLSTQPSRTVLALLLATVIHAVVVMAMNQAVFLYMVLIAPLLALLAGIGFDAMASWWSESRRGSRIRRRRATRLLLFGTTATLAVACGGWAAARSSRERLDERKYSLLPQLRYGELARYQRLDVAGRVAGDPALPKDGTIFGDPTIVSAVALDGGSRVAGELADFDYRWLEAGTVKREDVVSRIEGDHVAAIVTSPWFIAQSAYFRLYVMACYEIPKVFPSPEDGPGSGLFDILVYRHKLGSYPCHVPSAGPF